MSEAIFLIGPLTLVAIYLVMINNTLASINNNLAVIAEALGQEGERDDEK